MESKGKVMALDLGEKRIGVAISDDTRTIAKAYGVLSRKSRKEDYERYAKIIVDHKEKDEDLTIKISKAKKEIIKSK